MDNVKGDIETIRQMAARAFNRGSLLSLWQEIANNFYPERAEFTTTHTLGTDFASNLTTSIPVMARRDLGDMFSSMLRDQSIMWYKVGVDKPEDIDSAGKIWLEESGDRMRHAMYNKAAKFQRATKQGDHDYATFGQCAISKEMLADKGHLLYRCWHLRDVAWMEDEIGDPCPVFRKWKPTADCLNQEMKGNVSDAVKEMLKDPKQRFETVCVTHAVVRPDMYKPSKPIRTPYASIFFEDATGHICREEGVWTKVYTIPRWQIQSGSQYAHSPATIIALPDARLIQQMSLVLLDAGENAARPPLIATQDVVRGDVHQYSGGITWVDAEYDERLGEALRPMSIQNNGIPHGMQMREEIKKVLEGAFYLDKIGLPQLNGDMTAFETAQRVKEYVRKIIPLFAPIEADYNGSICEDTFTLLLKAGRFGSPYEMPESLSGQDIRFQFRSPLSENLDRQKAQSFQEARQMLAEVIPLDQSAAKMVNVRKALRDVLDGVGVPSAWIRPEEEMEEMDKAEAKQAQIQEAMAQMQSGAQIGKTMGEAASQFQKAGMQI